MMNNKLPPSIPIEQIETRKVLKKLTGTRAALAELKGATHAIPNETILIDTLSLREAKDSSEIENIITTHDELYKSDRISGKFPTAASKEVFAYADALKEGFREIQQHKLITANTIIRIQEIIEGNKAGFRKQPGTVLKDNRGNVVYEPPQDYDTIVLLMKNLEWFMNDHDAFDVDPLVKMAMVHHQFESIHPFYDGNGRTGRIINILYLVTNGLLNLPILYLSQYIIRNRQQYYKLLQTTRNHDNWEPWVLYMLEAVESTAIEAVSMIRQIKSLMTHFKNEIRTNTPRMYSQDLINNLFRYPYTRTALLQKELNVSRITATKYLDKLTEMGMLTKMKSGRSNYYINEPLFDLLTGDDK